MPTKTELLLSHLFTLKQTKHRLIRLDLPNALISYDILKTEEYLAAKPDPYAWYDPFD